MALGPEKLVWYAAYGSNCSTDRFASYLEGGPIAGTDDHQRGARDPTPPRASGPFEFSRQIVFTGHSRRWGGGYALLGHHPVDEGALGRRYLITREQFDDLVAQESRRPTTPTAFDTLTEDEVAVVGVGPYDGILALEPIEGIPVVTFTATSPPEELAPSAPSAAYLGAIVRGLVTVHDLAVEVIARRLLAAPGVALGWTASDVSALLERPEQAVRPMTRNADIPTLGDRGAGHERVE